MEWVTKHLICRRIYRQMSRRQSWCKPWAVQRIYMNARGGLGTTVSFQRWFCRHPVYPPCSHLTIVSLLPGVRVCRSGQASVLESNPRNGLAATDCSTGLSLKRADKSEEGKHYLTNHLPPFLLCQLDQEMMLLTVDLLKVWENLGIPAQRLPSNMW